MGRFFEFLKCIPEVAILSFAAVFLLRIVTHWLLLQESVKKVIWLNVSLRSLNALAHKSLAPKVTSVVVTVIFVSASVGDELRGNPKKYSYFRPDISSQVSINGGFYEPQRIDLSPHIEAEKFAERLHITEGLVGTDVTEEMLEHFETVLSDAYVDGALDTYSVPEFLLKHYPNYLNLDNELLLQAKRKLDSIQLAPNLAAEYDYGRMLNDAGINGERLNLPFYDMLDLMSDSVYILEDYLRYADRSVDGNYICKEYVAFVNGKLLLHNAPFAEKDLDGAQYANCLFAEAYAGFKVMAEQTNKNNYYYAILAYYTGNSGEQLLSRIDRQSNPELYETVLRSALQWYKNAKEQFESKQEYKTEPNIMNNILNGINTLTFLAD